MANNATPLAC